MRSFQPTMAHYPRDDEDAIGAASEGSTRRRTHPYKMRSRTVDDSAHPLGWADVRNRRLASGRSPN